MVRLSINNSWIVTHHIQLVFDGQTTIYGTTHEREIVNEEQVKKRFIQDTWWTESYRTHTRIFVYEDHE